VIFLTMIKLIPFTLLAAATPAAAQDVAEWRVGMGTQMCSAVMQRRDGAEVRLSRSTSDPGTIIRVTPPEKRGRDGGDPFGTYGFDLKISGSRAWRETVSRTDGGSAHGGGAGAVLDPDGLARMLASGMVQVTGDGPMVEIPLPPSNMVERDILACLDRLRIAERGSGEPAAVPPRPWNAFDPWLQEAASGREHFSGATLRLRLTVAAQGHTLDCTVTESSGDAELDRRVCVILRPRARFTPAADAAGRPTLGSYDVGIELKP
jgi:TonB family protein